MKFLMPWSISWHTNAKIHVKDTDVTYQPNGPNWPSLLDSFSLIAGQIATLIKYLKAPNTPVLG